MFCVGHEGLCLVNILTFAAEVPDRRSRQPSNKTYPGYRVWSMQCDNANAVYELVGCIQPYLAESPLIRSGGGSGYKAMALPYRKRL